MILSADMSIMLDRILDAATDNLRFAKILVQMGLDPNNVTWDAIFNRLLEIFLHNITLANMFALVGAIFFRHIADAHDGAAAGREHDRLRILRHLRRAHRSHHDLSSLSPDDSHQCLPSPTNARSREEGAHRNTGRHVDGVAQAVHDRPQVSQGRYLDEEG